MDFLLMDQLPEFCSRDNSVVMKEIFGLQTSFILHGEDEDKLRLQTLSEVGGVDSLEKMVDCSDSEDSIENSSNAP
ncbi:hypothetical protein DKX38_012004 [Salix brachista]|uniref:Uncharacterized protein n=1 Tax=Salix brachista TaxID=2182728 RepID=A0A5N5LMQ9_9ROSI|nr:hypothetical protein DKX38_012004 [Salix brachista]